jgi:hypothetical protein
MSVITFDWAQIAWIPNPPVPWWAEVHIFIGVVLFYWILTPILYYTNVRCLYIYPYRTFLTLSQTWQLADLPISANVLHVRFGKPYNVMRVLKPDGMFNLTAYQEYSPLYLPATYLVTYQLPLAPTMCAQRSTTPGRAGRHPCEADEELSRGARLVVSSVVPCVVLRV